MIDTYGWVVAEVLMEVTAVCGRVCGPLSGDYFSMTVTGHSLGMLRPACHDL